MKIIRKIVLIMIMVLVWNSEFYGQDNLSCTDCHDDILNMQYKHAPSEESCTDCHDADWNKHPEEGSVKLFEKVPDLCYMCHDAQNSKSNVHPPVDEGDCLMCHNPHSSKSKMLLNEITESEICLVCHEITKPTNSNLHSPVRKGQCTKCHNPHQSDYGSLLKAESTVICLSCHNRTYAVKEKKIENIGAEIKHGKSVHAAIELDGCITCHKGHSSENKPLLNAKYPEKDYVQALPENYALCFNCHEQNIITEKETTSATNFRSGNVNLHYFHINGAKGRNCNMCHNVHAGENEHLIRDKRTFQKWEMELKYKKSSSGGSCFPGCHGEKSYNR